MTAQPVAPVIPAPVRPAAVGRARLARPGRCRWPARRSRPEVVYGFGRIDASGRVADRAIIAALGWRRR